MAPAIGYTSRRSVDWRPRASAHVGSLGVESFSGFELAPLFVFDNFLTARNRSVTEIPTDQIVHCGPLGLVPLGLTLLGLIGARFGR